MSRFREYTKLNRIVAKYGIGYLDDKLKGISATDLVVIGARSGAGKSTLSKIISLANPNTKIKLFSLENFKDDDYAKECYFEYKKKSGESLCMVETLTGVNTNKINSSMLEEVETCVEKKFSHIGVVNRQDGFNVNKLRDDMIRAAEDGYELIILDHLDYLDKVDERDSDNQHISIIMKTIRKIQETDNIPIIAVSHLRKGTGREAPVVPNMDEFIGSSNKVKEATVVITFAPDDKTNEKANSEPIKATWCCIRKSRRIGIDNKVARLYFDTRVDKYQNDPDICVVNYSGTKIGKYIDGELVWEKNDEK